MKKKIALIIFALLCKISSAQTNEIKVDVFDILVLLALDVSYERNLNPESSLGISALFNFAESSSSFRYQEEFVLTPYYRQRLFSRGTIDYYGEFFGSINQGNIKIEDLELGEDPTYNDFALGLGFIGKYVSANGFVADFHLGIGRNLLNTSESPDVIPRVGISFGKQF